MGKIPRFVYGSEGRYRPERIKRRFVLSSFLSFFFFFFVEFLDLGDKMHSNKMILDSFAIC